MNRSIATAFKHIRRAPYQAFSALMVLIITFTVGYVFSLLLFGSEHVLRYFETRPQVTAFFKQTTTDDQITTINKEMTDKPYVSQVKLVTKDEALALYKNENKQDPLLLELVTADILPASIEVSGKEVASLEQIQKDLELHKDLIDEIVFQKSVIDSVSKWTRAIRTIGIVLISVLASTSVLVMMVMISMKVAMKKQEISVLRLLGATSWYINAPFLTEGLIYGLLGAVVGWGLSMILVLYATPWVVDFFGEISLLPLSWEFMAMQLGVGVAAGIMMGVFSSALALKRFIK